MVPQSDNGPIVWQRSHSLTMVPQSDNGPTVCPQSDNSPTVWQWSHSLTTVPQSDNGPTVWQRSHSLTTVPQSVWQWSHSQSDNGHRVPVIFKSWLTNAYISSITAPHTSSLVAPAGCHGDARALQKHYTPVEYQCMYVRVCVCIDGWIDGRMSE